MYYYLSWYEIIYAVIQDFGQPTFSRETEHMKNHNTRCIMSLPISGTDRATVIATQMKKAGSRIWEKMLLVFLFAQWNLFTISPWNCRSFSHQPSSLKLPWPSSLVGSGEDSSSGAQRVYITLEIGHLYLLPTGHSEMHLSWTDFRLVSKGSKQH